VFGINGMVAKTPGAVVVVDPNSFIPADSPQVAELIPGATIEEQLAAAVVDPNEVTHVLITHGHSDHFTAVVDRQDARQLRFPNAEHLFPADDMPAEGQTGGYSDEIRRVLGAVNDAGRLRLTRGDIEVTEGVTVLAAPGESAGHQIVRFDCGEDLVYYLGDLVHFPVEVEHLDWVAVPGKDMPVLIESRRRVFSDPGEKRATFVFTHSPFPGWGAIDTVGPDRWVWRFAN
jgi:glyoxylase-like metal-dependent hydrolase (beta-lactamase superfamily II)